MKINNSILFLSALALVLAAVYLGKEPSGIMATHPEKMNLLLILTDTLRADRLGIYGYSKPTSPHIDRFAKKSFIFQQALSQGPWTKPSVGSLLTSLYPHNHGAMSNIWQTLSEEALTLPEVLQKNGYHTLAVQTNPTLTHKFHFDQGFDEFRELTTRDIKNKIEMEPAEKVVDEFLSWTDQLKKEPFFAYLHFMDTHLPYQPPESHRSLFVAPYEGYFPPDKIRFDDNFYILKNLSSLTALDKNHISSLYDASVHYLDSQIGRLLDALQKRDMMKNTIILLVSDHGEELFEHGSFGHGQSLYNELLRVPMILYNPLYAPEGMRLHQPVRLIDVFPTVLSMLGLPQQNGLFGKDFSSLLKDPNKNWNEPSYAEGVSYWITPPGRSPDGFSSLQDHNHKVIHQKIDGSPSYEYYDLIKDPLEKLPLPLNSSGAKNLDKERRKTESKGERHQNPDIPSNDTEAFARLKSLGYLH